MSIEEQKRSLIYPRITRAYAESLIVKERIVVDKELLITVYMVQLKNGHRLVKDAIVANKELFDEGKGIDVAKRKVIDEIISNELYQMRTKLSEQINE